MWDDFTDFQLVELCYNYGIEMECQFNFRMELVNRAHVEQTLTEFELEMAFGE
jgi:hypothetical protein